MFSYFASTRGILILTLIPRFQFILKIYHRDVGECNSLSLVLSFSPLLFLRRSFRSETSVSNPARNQSQSPRLKLDTLYISARLAGGHAEHGRSRATGSGVFTTPIRGDPLRTLDLRNHSR